MIFQRGPILRWLSWSRPRTTSGSSPSSCSSFTRHVLFFSFSFFFFFFFFFLLYEVREERQGGENKWLGTWEMQRRVDTNVMEQNGGIPFWGWPISIGMISPVLFVSWFFPEEIILENGEPYYLNVSILFHTGLMTRVEMRWWRCQDEKMRTDWTWPQKDLAHGWWRDMTGWPWDLIPKKSPDYMIFLNLFIACQFTVSFLLAVLGGWIFIKRRWFR